MNHRTVAAQLADELLGDKGWDRPLEHHLRHEGTGVHVLVYGARVEIVFGAEPGHRYDKAVGTSTTYYPSTAIAAVLEVARALVFARQMLRAPLAEPDAGLPAGATGLAETT